MWGMIFLGVLEVYGMVSAIVGTVLLCRWFGVPEVGAILMALAAGFFFELVKMRAHEAAYNYEERQ